MQYQSWAVGFLLALGAAAVSCGDGTSVGDDSPLGAPNPDGRPGDAQTPPTTNGAAVEEWLEKREYESWACETSAQPQRKVSPHGFNRVCSNDLAATFVGSADDERPVGTASVKELYDDAKMLVGHAVAVKVRATSDGGDGWYWYERVPLDSAAPHDGNGVVADGLGSSGAAKTICASCHAGAGSDAAHDVMGSSDFVYLQSSAGGQALDPNGDEQTPPTTNAEDLEAWLEAGDYKSWACETAEHPQRKVSPHGSNRVCSNEVAAAFAGSASDERPIGTASVKELYDDSASLVGYAVAVKVAERSNGGANWFWYERIGDQVPANGLGSSGTPKSACVGCHVGAGADADHDVGGSSDFVYLQVQP